VTMRICVSILPKNSSEALNLIEAAEKAKTDLIEVRLDRLDTSTNLKEIVQGTKIPLIATRKLTSENGFFSGTEAERQQSLLNAAQSGFEYVDVDLSTPNLQETTEKLKQLGAKLIISHHKLDGTMSRSALENVLEQEISCGACVCKIVLTAKKIEDNLPVLNFVASHSRKTKLVCFCMGEAGRISRLLSPMFGAFFTFASLEQGAETAKGQMSIGEMKAAYSLLGAQ